MPGFPSIDTFYYLIDPLLRKMKHPLVYCLNDITHLLNHMVEEIMGEIAKEFPRFRDHILDKIAKLIEDSRKKS